MCILTYPLLFTLFNKSPIFECKPDVEELCCKFECGWIFNELCGTAWCDVRCGEWCGPWCDECEVEFVGTDPSEPKGCPNDIAIDCKRSIIQSFGLVCVCLSVFSTTSI